MSNMYQSWHAPLYEPESIGLNLRRFDQHDCMMATCCCSAVTVMVCTSGTMQRVVKPLRLVMQAIYTTLSFNNQLLF
jgi:hypothetical protein